MTDATFATKKIVLMSQAQSAANKEALNAGLVTKKKLGLKELLGKLNNQSLSTRLDGLEGLTELLTAHGQVAIDHLSTIIYKIAPLLSERESKLRRAGSLLLEKVILQVSSSQLEPLHSVICAHLCCGLSHIDPVIQVDSLRILDSIISSVPKFVAQHFHKLLPNCLDQISSASSTASQTGIASNNTHTKSGNGKNRVLNSSMDEKISTFQWRYEVVERLRKVLLTIQD